MPTLRRVRGAVSGGMGHALAVVACSTGSLPAPSPCPTAAIDLRANAARSAASVGSFPLASGFNANFEPISGERLAEPRRAVASLSATFARSARFQCRLLFIPQVGMAEQLRPLASILVSTSIRAGGCARRQPLRQGARARVRRLGEMTAGDHLPGRSIRPGWFSMLCGIVFLDYSHCPAS